MAATHAMTPARRAALRKAQMVSARKRRKHGAGYVAKRQASQALTYARSSAQLVLGKRTRSR